jgi:hypothetical protein
MTPNEQIQHVELSLEEAKKVVAFGEAIKRLEKNRDFQRVIFDGYFGDEAKRLVFLTAEPNLDEKAMQGTWSDIRGIGALRQFLMNRKVLGDIAAKDVADHAETLEELREVDAVEGDE